MINYDPHHWMDHFFDIKGSMVREILGRVAICFVWSILVVTAHKFGWKVAIPSTMHTLVGLALGLLLVFRTNASYDRYWEGRKLWGGIVNECRNVVRAASQFLHGDVELLRRLAVWTAAFPYATMNHLRGKNDLGEAVAHLPVAEARDAVEAEHTPMAVSLRMSECLSEGRKRGYFSEYTQMAIDQNVQLLVDYLGGCERIRKTPLPFAYVVHLRRALVIYCFTLPFALVEANGWSTIVDTLFLSYIFFGIEEIGVEIEGPFGYDDNDLPLEQICNTIRHNVLAMVGSSMEEAEPPMSGAL